MADGLSTWSVRVAGDPHTKGDLRCYGRGGMHRLTEVASREKKAWRSLLELAGRSILVQAGEALRGPVDIAATFTLPRPPSVPLRKREWPVVLGSGDTDKLQRMLLDAWQSAGVFGDDAQVVHLDVWKCYPDTPGCVGAMAQPGVAVTISLVTKGALL